MKKSVAFTAGLMTKLAESPLANALDDREDSRIHHLRRLSRMAPAERRRYLADMSARNHRLAMSKSAAKDDWKTYGAMAGLPFAGAGLGATLYGLSAFRGPEAAKNIGRLAAKGGATGGMVGLGALGLIGLGHLLHKADPKGRGMEAAVKLAPAVGTTMGVLADK